MPNDKGATRSLPAILLAWMCAMPCLAAIELVAPAGDETVALVPDAQAICPRRRRKTPSDTAAESTWARSATRAAIASATSPSNALMQCLSS